MRGGDDVTEAEILEVRNEATALVISIVSVGFGMVSAYLAGLWLFLRRTPALLRLLAFALLSFGMAFLGVVGIGLDGVLKGTDKAWTKLAAPATEIPSFGAVRIEALNGLTFYELGAAMGFTAFAAIYLALAFMTFFYRWPEDV